MSCMTFTLKKEQGDTPLTVEYDRLWIVGYSGRDQDSIFRHVRELEEQLGVPAPEKIPTVFHCCNYLLTQESALYFVGPQCSGEAEYVIVAQNGRIYIGLGSDHTDRALEASCVSKAKQICAKPVCAELWDYADLKDHWDSITLKSWYTVDDQTLPYQSGSLAEILPVETILQVLSQRMGDVGNCVIFSGTVPLLHGYQYGSEFCCELADPVLHRRLCLNYHAESIPEGAY